MSHHYERGAIILSSTFLSKWILHSELSNWICKFVWIGIQLGNRVVSEMVDTKSQSQSRKREAGRRNGATKQSNSRNFFPKLIGLFPKLLGLFLVWNSKSFQFSFTGRNFKFRILEVNKKLPHAFFHLKPNVHFPHLKPYCFFNSSIQTIVSSYNELLSQKKALEDAKADLEKQVKALQTENDRLKSLSQHPPNPSDPLHSKEK